MAHYTTKVSRKYLAYVVGRIQLNGKKLSAVTVDVRNNSQPAGVLELADEGDSKSLAVMCMGSSPIARTNNFLLKG